MYFTDGKFCVARLRGNYTHIIKPFDTLDDAIAYAETLLEDWNYFSGLPCVTVRQTRKNPDEWVAMGLKPYTDNIVWCKFDIEKADEADRIMDNRRRNKKAKELGCDAIVRGLRAVTDFEFEFQLSASNEYIDNSIETVFFMSSNGKDFISSSNVKEFYFNDVDVASLVPDIVVEMFKNKK